MFLGLFFLLQNEEVRFLYENWHLAMLHSTHRHLKLAWHSSRRRPIPYITIAPPSSILRIWTMNWHMSGNYAKLQGCLLIVPKITMSFCWQSVSGQEDGLFFDRCTGMPWRTYGMAWTLSFGLSHCIKTASPVMLPSSTQIMTEGWKFFHIQAFFGSKLKLHSFFSWYCFLPLLGLLGISSKQLAVSVSPCSQKGRPLHNMSCASLITCSTPASSPRKIKNTNRAKH